MMPVESERLAKPLLCRLGLHRWYSDGAMIYRADRCDRCGVFRDAREAQLLELARQIIDQECDKHPESFATALGAAQRRFDLERLKLLGAKRA